MPFENPYNEFHHEEFLMIKDIYYSLEYLNKTNPQLVINNESIKRFAKSSNELEKGYPEHQAKVDPFKDNVLNGLALSLSELGANTIGNAQSLKFQTSAEASIINKSNYPYVPDLLFAYKNKQIALWIVNRDKYVGEDDPNYTTKGNPLNGHHRLQERILRAMNPDDNIWCAYLPIEDIVDYDLENLKANINTNAIKSFKFLQGSTHNSYINDFAKVTQWFVKSEEISDKISHAKIDGKDASIVLADLMLEFFNQIQPKNQSMLHTSKYHQNLLKYLLLNINLISQKVNSEIFDKFCQDLGYTDFKGLLMNIKSSIDSEATSNNPKVDDNIDQSWVGTRLGVEIPNMKHNSKKSKDIGTELLNRNFLWCDNYYFSYDDWSETLKNTYDGFNLQVKAPEDTKSKEKYFYQNNWRRTLKGIFPDAKGKRELYYPNVKETVKNAFLPQDMIEKNKEMEWNETLISDRENRAMIVEELKTQKQDITLDTKMMTNLQNLKHNLKKNFNDNEILNFLTSFDFTDALIEQHLKMLSDKSVSTFSIKTKHLPRDPSSYRKYLKSLQSVKDRYDPYTNHFLSESLKEEYIGKTLPNKVRFAKTPEEKEHYQEILDKALLNKEFREQSYLNIGTYAFKNYDINIDLNTLVRDENDYNEDHDTFSNDISDEAFLAKQKVKAETNFIKTQIIRKLNDGQSLSESESKYLKLWKARIGSSMTPHHHSDLSLGSLSKADQKKLNSLPLIDISGLNDYSLNDLILELNLFIDPKSISTLEHEVQIEGAKTEWGLPDDFIATEQRHKEIDLVLGEVEENAYRHSAQFEQHEIDGLKDMFIVDQEDGIYKKAWLNVDLKEFDNFDFNSCDDRLQLLEKWFEKKEREIKTRIFLPKEHMMDQKLYQHKLSEKTHEIISKIFSKPYSELTEHELREFVTSLSSRMMLFGKFPSFMPYLVFEIYKHPNLNKIDQEHLETYCDMFELKWRGDSDKPNWLSPIKTDFSRKIDNSLDDDVIVDKLKKASGDSLYIQNLKQKFMEMSN